MIKVTTILFLLTILSSCSTTSHRFMRGTIAMVVNKETAHICLGDNEVKPGDGVTFFVNNCDRNEPGFEGLRALCRLEELGKGIVSKNLNSHYSEVKTNGKFSLRKGTLVQKN